MTYNRVTVLLTISLCFFTLELSAQQSPEEHVFQFFKTFKTEGYSAAIDHLYAANDWIDGSGEAVVNLKRKLAGITQDFVGHFNGYELITSRMVGKSLLLKSYMVRYDRQPIRFQFIFYKPKEEWVIHSFQYDGNLSNELEEATQLFMLREDY